MNKETEPVLSVEPSHLDDVEHSHVMVALRGVNRRTLNRRSTTLYHIISGRGVMEVNGQHHDLKPGVIIEVPPNTPYQDVGRVDLEAVSFPPFNIDDVEEVK
jgi:mannose-6-phosphate isomerase-like protein (cupin superfamily)